MRPPLLYPHRRTTPLPGPASPPSEDDMEWRELALILSIRRNLGNPDPLIPHLIANWAAEIAVLQEIRRGWNDPG